MSKRTLGALINELHDLREKKRAIKESLDKVEAEYDALDAEIQRTMAEQGLDKATGDLGTVFIEEKIYPNVEDWDRYYAYIHRNKYYHLLERRPSVTGCRELFETKGKIPGVVPILKRRLNLRSTNNG